MQPPRRCQEGGLRSGLRSRGSRVRPTSGGAAESRGWNGGAEGLVSPNLAHQDLQRSAGIWWISVRKFMWKFMQTWWDMMDVGDGKAKVKLKVGWDGFATFWTCALTAFTAFTDAEVSCCPTWRKIQVLDPSFGRWGVRTRHRWSHMEFQCNEWMDGWMDRWMANGWLNLYDFIYGSFFRGARLCRGVRFDLSESYPPKKYPNSNLTSGPPCFEKYPYDSNRNSSYIYPIIRS